MTRPTVYTPPGFVDRTGYRAECRRDVRRRRKRPTVLLVTWASLVIPVAITAAGWLIGKPLTPELLAALGTLVWFARRLEGRWQARLTDHSDAIRAIAARQDISTGRAETVYALVERQIEAELVRTPQALPPGGRRP